MFTKWINSFEIKFIYSFRKHYALYNVHNHLIEKVTLLKDILNENEFSVNWQDNYEHHLKEISKEELYKKGFDEIYYTDLTTCDVKQFNLEIVKVVTPKLHLLTGNFNYPYLGLFEEGLDLMIDFPHPFP